MHKSVFNSVSISKQNYFLEKNICAVLTHKTRNMNRVQVRSEHKTVDFIRFCTWHVDLTIHEQIRQMLLGRPKHSETPFYKLTPTTCDRY